ncbi:IS3 family transposase [Evansella clarkii]|uniref:IS3 family transposase n=1 Tax=Evansella clarkii TaxID=79879 RepID=UPI000997E25E|nr:IS3 family transposase [Evansella clarkii]
MKDGFPVTRTTRALNVERSLYYYHQKNKQVTEESFQGRPVPGFSLAQTGIKISDEQIEEFLMEAVEGEEGIYGYRKLTNYLKDQHKLVINPKKVYRLCEKLNILLPQRRKSKYPRRLAKQHTITASNQLWQVDIKYGSIEGSGRFVFLASAIDVYDRCIVGYYRGPECKATNITKMLQGALLRRGIHYESETSSKLIIRTDNGPQFVSEHFGRFCEHQHLYHERIPSKSPDLNAYIESFHSVIERECYQRYRFECFEEAYYRIDEYMDFYNNRRYHGSLKYLSPAKFYKLYSKGNCPQIINL